MPYPADDLHEPRRNLGRRIRLPPRPPPYVGTTNIYQLIHALNYSDVFPFHEIGPTLAGWDAGYFWWYSANEVDAFGS